MLKNHSMNMVKHQICTIYKILININTPDEIKIKEKWEELGIDISAEDWRQINVNTD